MTQRLGLWDRLSNLVSGLGTTVDKRVFAGYNFLAAQPAEVEAAYRTSWLMRKIVDIPAIDMTRAWRSWQADRDIIEIIEAEEKRLCLKHKVKRALVLARLWGGGAIVIGVKGQGTDPMQELQPERTAKGGLAYLHVFARNQITVSGEMIADPESPWFGHPTKYMLNRANGATAIDIHPSRVVAFVGQPAPEGSTLQADWFWGDPLYQSILSAIQNADLAQEGFAVLIDEAKNDIIKIPDMMAQIGSAEYEGRLKTRLSTANALKSSLRALILDSAEEWEQRQITWTGIPEIIGSYLQIVAGAADIPVTRMLGQSPKGLQSTGEGEEKDYHAMIEARQDEMLSPALDRIDEFLLRSALGSRPEEIWYRFNPLVRLTPKEAAEVESKRAQTIKTYSDTGLIEAPALATIAKTAMTESGQWPGSDEAFEENEGEWEQEGKPKPPGFGAPEDDPEAVAELETPEERETRDRRRPRRIMDARIDDARPRSLYVSRKLINADDLIRWAKAQGFETTQPADEMHVTIAFSRKPVDWMTVGDDWSSDEDGKLRVKPGGPRVVEALGDKGAVVLMFRNDSLEWRHRRIHEEGTGAQWDWPEYQPHVTITWQAGDIDLSTVEPYQGPLVFGPERFAEVVDDWEKTIEEA
jgi:phage-related protein (TIGR01555 family)